MDIPDKKRKIPPQKNSPVKKRKSRILIILAGSLAGILIIITAVVFSVDPNNFREPVVQVLNRATGLNISIEFIDWSFSRGLQFKCKGLRIQSADQKKELLSTDELLLKLELLPLLEKRVVVDRITLIKPVIKVPLKPETKIRPATKVSLKPATGLSVLNESKAPEPDPSPTSSALAQKNISSPEWLQALREFLKNPNLALAEIDLVGGQIIFQDEGTGKELPLDIAVKVRIVREENKVGLMLNDLEFGTGNIIAAGEVRANDLLSANASLQVKLDFKPFKATDFLPVLAWVPQARSAVDEKMRLQGNFDDLALKFEAPVATLTDFESVARNANLDLTLKTTGISMIQSGKRISFPTFEAVAQWKNRQMTHKISWSVLAGSFGIEGKYFQKDPSGSVLKGTLDSHLTFAKVDFRELKNILPDPMPWFPETGVIDGTVHLKGPLQQPEAMQGRGKLKFSDIEVRVKTGSVRFPVIEAEGTWSNNKLVHNIRAKVFDGNIQVKGQLKLGQGNRGPVIDSDVVIDPVQLARLKPVVAQDWFPATGTVAGKVHLQGPVMQPQALQAEGKIRVQAITVPIQGKKVRIAKIDGAGQWSGTHLKHDIRMSVFGGEIRIKGDLNLIKDSKGDWVPVIDSDVIPKSVRFADLRPLVQQDGFPETGVIDGTVHLKGPVMRLAALRVKAKFKVPKTVVQVRGTKVAVANFDAQGEWHNGRLIHKVGMKIFGGEIRVQGKLDLKKDKQGAWDPVIDSDVITQSIRLPNIKPLVQKDWFPEKGLLTGKVHLKGPAKRFAEIDITGDFTGQRILSKINKKLVAVKKVLVSASPKSKAGLSIDFDLTGIKIGKITLKKVSGKTLLTKTSFDLKRAKIFPEKGAVLLKGTYNLKTTSYKLDVLGKELRLENYNQKYIRGPLSFRGNFFGSLLSEDFKKGLSGNLTFNSKKGDISTAGTAMSNVLSVLNFQTPSNTKGGEDGVLPYDFLGANCKIKNGVLSTKDFKLESPLIRVLGYGKIDSPNEILDAEVRVTPLQGVGNAIQNLEVIANKSISTAGKDVIKKIPLLGDILTGDGKDGQVLDDVLGKIFQNEKGGGLLGEIFKEAPSAEGKTAGSGNDGGLLNVYFRVEGTFDEPSVTFLPQKTIFN